MPSSWMVSVTLSPACGKPHGNRMNMTGENTVAMRSAWRPVVPDVKISAGLLVINRAISKVENAKV